MTRFTSPLRSVKVAGPCSADWEGMIGGDRSRFCSQCELNVYNLSAMSTLEAESLIARTEGRLCVRYYRRKDGSIITQDCPVGLRRLKQRAARIKKAVASLVLGFLAGLGFHSGASRFGDFVLDSTGRWEMRGAQQGKMVVPTNRQPEVLMGDIELKGRPITPVPASAKRKAGASSLPPSSAIHVRSATLLIFCAS